MHPVLFEIGSFKVHTFGVALVIAFFAGLFMARARAVRWGLDPAKVADGLFWTLIAGVLGARILFIVQEWGYYSEDYSRLLTLQFEGLTSFGGFLFGGLFLVLWARKTGLSLRRLLDVVAAPTLLAYAIGRVGCFFNGCCAGGKCVGHGWCVTFPETPMPAHPAQLYETGMTLLGLGILLLAERRGLQPGQSFAGFLILNGLSRFIYEFWRAGTVAQVRAGEASSTYWGSLPITQAQAVAAGMVLAGVVLFLMLTRRGEVRQELPVS